MEKRKIIGKGVQIFIDGSLKVKLKDDKSEFGKVPENELYFKELAYPEDSAFSYQALTLVNKTTEYQVIGEENGMALLSLKQVQEEYIDSIKAGDIIKGKIINITQFGIFVKLYHNIVEMVHVTELSHCRVLSAADIPELTLGNIIPLKVISNENGVLKLSYKRVFGESDQYKYKYNKGDIVTGIIRLETKEHTGRYIHFSPVLSGIVDYANLPAETVQKIRNSYGEKVRCFVRSKKFDKNDNFLGLKLDFCSF